MNEHLLINLHKAVVSPESVRGHEDASTTSFCNKGYLLFANNTVDGTPWCWAAPDMEFALRLANTLCESTGQDVKICKWVGTVCRQKIPTEFVPTIDGERIEITQPKGTP